MLVVVIGEFSFHTFYLAVDIILQRLDGNVPVIWYAPVGGDLGFIIRNNA